MRRFLDWIAWLFIDEPEQSDELTETHFFPSNYADGTPVWIEHDPDDVGSEVVAIWPRSGSDAA